MKLWYLVVSLTSNIHKSHIATRFSERMERIADSTTIGFNFWFIYFSCATVAIFFSSSSLLFFISFITKAQRVNEMPSGMHVWLPQNRPHFFKFLKLSNIIYSWCITCYLWLYLEIFGASLNLFWWWPSHIGLYERLTVVICCDSSNVHFNLSYLNGIEHTHSRSH